eukprot:2577522-Prymnesium_polylepis.1
MSAGQQFATVPINFARDGNERSSTFPNHERAASMPVRLASTKPVRDSSDSLVSAFQTLHSNSFSTPPPRSEVDLDGYSSPLAA